MSDTMLQQVSAETMRFMRGKYALDEIGNGVDELSFCENGEVIFTIRICDGHYNFQIGEALVSVTCSETLEIAKALIVAKKEPNRKPFPKENALYSNCGQRCDLCIHYIDSTRSEAFLAELKERLARVYKGSSWDDSAATCNGCHNGGLAGDFSCPLRKCATEAGHESCMKCPNHPCDKPHAGLPPEIHIGTILADDVTWGILPFVHKQYGN